MMILSWSICDEGKLWCSADILSHCPSGDIFLCSHKFPLCFAIAATIFVAVLWASVMAFRWALYQCSHFEILINHFSLPGFGMALNHAILYIWRTPISRKRLIVCCVWPFVTRLAKNCMLRSQLSRNTYWSWNHVTPMCWFHHGLIHFN